MSEILHVPGDGGLFDSKALCGIDIHDGRALYLTSVLDEVDCVVCMDLLRQADA